MPSHILCRYHVLQLSCLFIISLLTDVFADRDPVTKVRYMPGYEGEY